MNTANANNANNVKHTQRTTLTKTTRTLCALAAWSLLSTAALTIAQDAVAAQQLHRHAADRILVEPKAGLSDAEFGKTLGQNGMASRGRLRGLRMHVVQLGAGQDAAAMAAAMARHPNVKFAEVDRLVPPAATTNDPMLGNQWHLARINAPVAWDAASGAGTVVAIIDTGVNGAHPDLAALMVPGWNAYDNNADASDVYGHGTAVAGVVAAASNNAVGIAGLAYGAKLMPVRISDANGWAYWSTVAAGLTWAVDNGARVANISYGGVDTSAAVQSAAAYMRSKGGVVVVSAGNNGVEDATTPTDTMIVVSATDSADAKTSWSSFGAAVDLAAPGQNLVTTGRGGGYETWWGTSFSSPVVAGVAALVRSAKPGLTAAQIEQALFTSAVDLGAAGKDTAYGYGRVDAARAVAAAQAAVSVDAQAPVVAIAAPVGGTVSGSVSVSVNATDNVGVARVDLTVNGAVVATDLAAPYTFVWNSATVADGAASLVAVAYDAAGNVASSQAVGVTVSNAVAVDKTLPTVVINNPVDGAKVSGTSLTVSGSASDVAGIGSMALYVDGRKVASSTSGSVSYKWGLRALTTGAHTITVTATDKAGNASSKTVTVTK